MVTVERVIVKVGIADINYVVSPGVIRTSGLGSCVGVVLYAHSIAGMVHVMLPSSTLAKTTDFNHSKYADTGIDALVNLLLDKGTKKRDLRAKISGGAQMFQFQHSNDTLRIGPRNVEAVKDKLLEHSIPILGEDCGGNSGRTIEFNPASEKLMIKTVNKGVTYI
ncbi:chemotaxis protein CheD [Sutcliffiella cohnii]